MRKIHGLTNNIHKIKINQYINHLFLLFEHNYIKLKLH